MQPAWPCGDLCDPDYQVETGYRIGSAVGTRLDGNKPGESFGWILLGGIAAAGFVALIGAACGDRQ
jgi:hypothetical protein